MKFQTNSEQRYRASEERNSSQHGKWYSARRDILNTIVYCTHGLDPDCDCVRNFEANKSCPLTERQAEVAVASFKRSEMEKNYIRDNQRYRMLTDIIKSKRDQDLYIREYESKYGSLLSGEVLNVDGPSTFRSSYIWIILLVLCILGFALYFGLLRA
jgi:hypothetical protein